jgi:recombination protein RecA
MLIKTASAESPKEAESKQELAPLAPLSRAEKLKAILSVERLINKEYKSPLLQRMGERVGELLPSFPTGIVSVDSELIGCDGVPKGRIIEIFGPEASGKTTIALSIIAAVQQAGGFGAYVDAEHSLDPSHAARMGVDVDAMLISQPDYGEQALAVVEALLRSRGPDVIVVDSVSALVPKAELDGDMGESHMGLQARLMSQAMRKLTGLANHCGVSVIFINQIREKIGVSFGDPEVTSGGRALKFYASLRIKIRQLAKGDGGIIEDESGKRVGQRCRLTAVKNKCGGAPYSTTDITLMYATGWDKALDVVDYAERIGVVTEAVTEKGTAKKGWWHFGGTDYRRNDLQSEPLNGNIKIAVQQAIEAKRKANAERAAKQRAESQGD